MLVVEATVFPPRLFYFLPLYFVGKGEIGVVVTGFLRLTSDRIEKTLVRIVKFCVHLSFFSSLPSASSGGGTAVIVGYFNPSSSSSPPLSSCH